MKVTSSGKLLRRHQLGAGHLKSNKSKGAINRQKKSMELKSADTRRYKRLMGI